MLSLHPQGSWGQLPASQEVRQGHVDRTTDRGPGQMHQHMPHADTTPPHMSQTLWAQHETPGQQHRPQPAAMPAAGTGCLHCLVHPCILPAAPAGVHPAGPASCGQGYCASLHTPTRGPG